MRLKVFPPYLSSVRPRIEAQNQTVKKSGQYYYYYRLRAGQMQKRVIFSVILRLLSSRIDCVLSQLNIGQLLLCFVTVGHQISPDWWQLELDEYEPLRNSARACDASMRFSCYPRSASAENNIYRREQNDTYLSRPKRVQQADKAGECHSHMFSNVRKFTTRFRATIKSLHHAADGSPLAHITAWKIFDLISKYKKRDYFVTLCPVYRLLWNQNLKINNTTNNFKITIR